MNTTILISALIGTVLGGMIGALGESAESIMGFSLVGFLIGLLGAIVFFIK